ncbi:DUF4326 domain-containing protein [Nocardiopsis sp. CT-R113]|uniref:DUF4326 domain-containing protein n=1 Tax=Nocardiopsis codii TaxID=3065942 RepID=A0ABU7KD07_9ACTN|nr:DUF4326 domain-containing protein [Nocardiopsis sp. CT-R113]MEE2040111.1 DUF4326 domain-containing protein [Nocardiopsis sp. CT-R113]
MTAPARVQRSRTRGWKAPAGTRYVGRPTRWGNPFVVRPVGDVWIVVDTGRGPARERSVRVSGEPGVHHTVVDARRAAADLYALHIGPMGLYEFGAEDLAVLRAELGGRDLMCWCPPGPCHADTLLTLANPT